MLFKQANTLVTENWNDDYFLLHDHVFTNGDIVPSRNGNTREILNFKTQLTNPLHRCTAGYNRNVNIFFLLAESMWIFKGRRDLEFLEIFNKQMRDYSDDGKNFHAPYGWRMRKYNIDPSTEADSSNLPYFDSGRDQLFEALTLLYNNPADRRVVVSLWNPDFDLSINKKDHPCNSMLMFKIRNGALHQTIQNRSNDLNWGLTTNVFQFSFIGEVMAQLLGVRYGTQTHNSQSLHLYESQALTAELQGQFAKGSNEPVQCIDLYTVAKHLPIEFKFREEDMSMIKKLYWIDFQLHAIIVKLLNRFKENVVYSEEEKAFESDLKTFCYNFFITYKILCVYVDYKKHKERARAINDLLMLNVEHGIAKYDIFLLAMNFFMRRVLDTDKDYYAEVVGTLRSYIPAYKNIPIGHL